jgi:hypothetical protein
MGAACTEHRKGYRKEPRSSDVTLCDADRDSSCEASSIVFQANSPLRTVPLWLDSDREMEYSTINVNGESISAYHGQIHKFGMREYVLNAWRDVCLTAQQPLRAATSDIFSDRSHPLTFTAEPTSLKSHTPCRTHPHSLLYRPVPDHGIASKPKFEAGNGSRSRTQTPDTTRNSARLARAPERAQPANPTRSHAS